MVNRNKEDTTINIKKEKLKKALELVERGEKIHPYKIKRLQESIDRHKKKSMILNRKRKKIRWQKRINQ